MSQNKTQIQGLEPFDGNSGPSDRGTQNFYSRNSKSTTRGTIVPGMNENAVGPVKEREDNKRSTHQSGKPIVGFLYSISRTPIGEYWPLHIGRNTIGQSQKCDVFLPEGTVSSDHAVLVVRQIKNTGGVIAAITDTQSTNGTMINGETIGFTAMECHDKDIITIGNNYELVLVLMDASQLGISVSENFIHVEVDEDEEFSELDIPNFESGKTRPGIFNPYDEGPAAWGNNSAYRPADGTVGMDGSKNGDNHGGTVPL